MAPRMKGGGSSRSSLVAYFWLHCLLLWGQCWAYHCNDKYRKLSPRHTICLPHRQDCSIASAGVSRKEIQEIMAAHNNYRQMVAMGKVPGFPPAANMMELVWDNELAAVAQAHAKQCRFHHDCYSCRRVSRFTAGQNMFLHYSSSLRLKPTNWASVVRSWFEEYKLFNPHQIDSFRTVQDSGHFTQLIWAKTTHVGCGKTRFKIKEEDWYRTLYTCNYGPMGNVIQSRVYEKGRPCSLCPNRTSCSASVPGLCRLRAMPLARLSPADVVRVYHFPQQRMTLANHVRVYHFPQQMQKRIIPTFPVAAASSPPPMPLRTMQVEPMQRIQQRPFPLNTEGLSWRRANEQPELMFDPFDTFSGPLQRVSRREDREPQEPLSAASAENSSCKCDEAAMEQMRKKLLSLIPRTQEVMPEIQIKCQCRKRVSP
ncbi:CRISP/Allergen/PR-1-like isoform X2 [Dermacentor andersoni]|nr:CRISP/Allergen/PR-1-like isoform X2 [Dermacentor andersoni]XP_054927007.1 CRISP/Allergen/PR-1-like isoform X2 [Dermacentor andersoni]